MASWIELSANKSEANKGNELKRFADPLVKRVSCKANIVKGDLKPGGPENTKEAHVSQQVVDVGDGMIGSKCGEVGNEEEVEEEFYAVGFVSLGKD